MDNVKNDAYYIKKMLKDLSFIIENTREITLEQLEDNEMLCDSVLFRLIQISESCARLTNAFKDNHKEIPWQAIRGMRNRVVHEYGEVEFDIVYETITKDIPFLYRMLEKTI